MLTRKIKGISVATDFSIFIHVMYSIWLLRNQRNLKRYKLFSHHSLLNIGIDIQEIVVKRLLAQLPSIMLDEMDVYDKGSWLVVSRTLFNQYNVK